MARHTAHLGICSTCNNALSCTFANVSGTPVLQCKELITYSINEDCTGCVACVKACPEAAIAGTKKQVHTIDQSKCIKCGACRSVCKFDAVVAR